MTKYLGRANNKPSTRNEELEFLTELKQMYKLPFQIAVTDRNEDVMKYGIITYPTTILLDRVVRYMEFDAGMKGEENPEDMIKKLLKQ